MSVSVQVETLKASTNLPYLHDPASSGKWKYNVTWQGQSRSQHQWWNGRWRSAPALPVDSGVPRLLTKCQKRVKWLLWKDYHQRIRLWTRHLWMAVNLWFDSSPEVCEKKYGAMGKILSRKRGVKTSRMKKTCTLGKHKLYPPPSTVSGWLQKKYRRLHGWSQLAPSSSRSMCVCVFKLYTERFQFPVLSDQELQKVTLKMFQGEITIPLCLRWLNQASWLWSFIEGCKLVSKSFLPPCCFEWSIINEFQHEYCKMM